MKIVTSAVSTTPRYTLTVFGNATHGQSSASTNPGSDIYTSLVKEKSKISAWKRTILITYYLNNGFIY